MFLKPFSVRSNSQIKSCEKKQLLNSFYDQYELDPTNILEIFKTKDVHRLKVITSSEIKVNIYKFGNIPLIIENEKERLPTDLMLPGVVTDGPILPYTFNKIEKGVLCCISTTSNHSLVSSFNRPILPWPIINESSPKTNEEIDNVDDGSKSPVNILSQQISDDKNISEELNNLYLKEAVG
ncbi:unnamed protein product [Schistosoma mattheei]|uniref:Uncharacterized protein n=1 Tax=Schistosoma mattheei TaxID=31246 RepID=A0A183PNA0_9TREM|nr:unnamed protein product [Schistosoma mattheei]